MKVLVRCDDCDRTFETEDEYTFDALYGSKIFLNAVCPYCDCWDIKEV